ncbi:MAG: cell division protein FtsL [Acidobacteria bacterium]|nr:MAG: cell division protein FtsL [Acidobacteriota bacterium]PYY09106.1 MAG: cell division protein FtsL [Acidobacteriota bacterium]
MAAGAIAAQGAISSIRRQLCWTGTPEVYFAKHIDNSRLVKMDDPQRAREMRTFSIALACLCLLVLSYAWQHFKAVEYGYKISELQSERDSLVEMSRALRLEEATLRSPDRIDVLAKRMGLNPPEPGQVVRLDAAVPDNSGPVMASAAPVSVVSVP